MKSLLDWFARRDWRVLPPLLVTLGAIAATAHGGFMVALAAGVPVVIAVLYPLITDGLALVAYIAARAGLSWLATAYAWFVTVVAAGLSGLAQAVYLQSQGHPDITGWLGFGIGYWPAVAGLLAAHLVYIQRERRSLPRPGVSKPEQGDQISPLVMGVPRRGPDPGALVRAAMAGAEIVRSSDVTDAEVGELRPFVTDPVIRAGKPASQPKVELTKLKSAKPAKPAVDDTARARLLRIARDLSLTPEERMAAAVELRLSQAKVGDLFGVPQHVGRRLLAKPDQASSVLAASRFASQATKEANR